MKRLLATTMLMMSLCVGANATPTLITSVNSPSAVIDFSVLSPGTVVTNQFQSVGFTVSSGLLYVSNNPGDTNLFPGHPTGIATSYGGGFPGSTFTITFSQAVNQVGFYEELNRRDNVTLTEYRNGVNVGSLTLPGVPNYFNNIPFYGISDTGGFDTLVFSTSHIDNGFFAMSNLTYSFVPASAIPAPGSIIMLVGLMGLALVTKGNRPA